MVASRKIRFALPILLLGLSMAPHAKASSFSFTGTFQQDDNVELFGFSVDTLSAITLQTRSYGGGLDALGQTIPSGGFATVLSLYSGSGSLIDFTLNGSCPPGRIDPASGLCGDAFLSRTLSSGSYLLALTEFFNAPNGLNLADGFLETGAGNFTGPLLCGVQGGFLDSGCDRRNDNFEVDVIGAATAAAVPEPASIWMLGLALIGFTVPALAKVRRRGRALLQK